MKLFAIAIRDGPRSIDCQLVDAMRPWCTRLALDRYTPLSDHITREVLKHADAKSNEFLRKASAAGLGRSNLIGEYTGAPQHAAEHNPRHASPCVFTTVGACGMDSALCPFHHVAS